MLVLSRRKSERIMIGNAELKIVHIGQNKVKLGIVAPPEVPICRSELLERTPAVGQISGALPESVKP